jgi:hypothetical protein
VIRLLFGCRLCADCVLFDVDRREFKTRDKSLEFLSGIVTDLFVDWAKLQGVDAKHKLRQLAEILMTGDFDRVVEMFLTTASASASRRK